MHYKKHNQNNIFKENEVNKKTKIVCSQNIY